MFNKLNIIEAIAIVYLAATGIKTAIEARQNAKLFITAAQAYEETQNVHEAQITYLCHMLEEHDVPIDEFDMIALNFNAE